MIAFDPAAVGQPRIDHRRGLIQAPPQRREDALHDAFYVMVIDKPQVTLVQQPLALNEHPMGAVDQDFSDGGIAQQHFQGAEAR